MPQKYTGRVVLILAILLVTLWMIFPKGNLSKPNLKPGIDMAGGTKLIYEIKPPPGGELNTNLAEQVMEALKKRVDPDGVRNLIWRPQGNNRLEIQMPASSQSAAVGAKRVAFSEAQERLEQTNLRRSEVLRAVEGMKGEQQKTTLAKLAMGSATRAKLFDEMATVYDQIQQAAAQKNAPVQAEKEDRYETLKSQIEDTNLTAGELQSILDAKEATQKEKLGELTAKYADFPQRKAAIEQFQKAYPEYNQVKAAIDDAGELKRLLKGSGVLEFHMLVDGADLSSPEAIAMRKRLEKGGRGPGPQANDNMRWYLVDQPNDFQRNLIQMYNDKAWALAWVTSGKQMVNGPGISRWALESAFPERTELGVQAVGFRFDAQGAKYFGEMTGNNLKKLMSVMLDDKIISAATIQSQITRVGIISRDAGYSESEFRYLLSTLNAGSLPAQLAEEPISEQTVGPQLGQDNLRRGLIACIFGLCVVAVFLMGYYYVAGAVAMVAVTMNMVVILGVMAALNATFTLPGIAGIVLTIGMAVDANVLIFERLREEQLRGLSLRMALRNAYDRAFSAILDSNVTTGITALVLYWFGSEEVKGFGLTLLIGLVSSLFTALFVTKTIFGLLLDKGRIQKLSSLPLTYPKWDQMLKPNIDWMGKAWIFYAFSGTFITLGLALFVYKFAQGQMLDIEFASGTSVQFELKQKTPIEEVRRLIEGESKTNQQALPSPSVVSVGSDGLVYEVVTPNVTGQAVKAAVIQALGERLKLELPSKFDHVDEPIDRAAASKAVLPIESDLFAINGFTPRTTTKHLGGVAIVLTHLDPPLSVKEVRDRINQQRLQPEVGGASAPRGEFDVETAGAEAGAPIVVLMSDPKLPYDQDPQKWQEELAAPVWKLVNEAVNRPADLQKINNFDAQVAGEAQTDALLALCLSIAVIMAYIWVRFGNLKYGTATVVALAHDTLFTLAAIGFAHFMWDTGIGRALLIEPFRLNLTLVAAILTVMGYSMNDTVVVFDRIRENRGKFGHVNRMIVNDSINQTLSRTLLTGGTTIITIFVMYIWGGAGIHGFTFALLVGIVVGTYSSIAIASPILLIGGEPAAEGAKKSSTGLVQRAGA